MAESTLSVLKRTYTEWSSHNAMHLAAAMAFYTMMSLAPLLVVALTALTFIYKDKAQSTIQNRAALLVGNNGAGAITEMLQASAQHPSSGIRATIISFVIALVSASGLFASLQDAINTIWDVKPKPDAGWKAMASSRLFSMLILAGSGLVLAASLIVSTVLTVIVKHLPAWLSWLSFAGDVVVSFLVIGLIFALIFKYLPDVIIDWKDVWIGAAITGGLFLVGKYGLTLYFRFASVAPFGAAGSLAALLIFVYYSAALLFFGAEFTRVFAESRGHPVEPDHFAVKLSTEDRGKRGEPHPEEIEEAQAKKDGQGRGATIPAARSGHAASIANSAIGGTDGQPAWLVAGMSVAMGAAIGVVGALTVGGRERRIKSRAAELRLPARLYDAEQHLRRAGDLQDVLKNLSVKDRIDAVAKTVHEVARRA